MAWATGRGKFSLIFLWLLGSILLLSPPGAGQQIGQQISDEQNYRNCLTYGPGPFCDLDRLTPLQRAEVEAAARRRTYHACLNGYVTCDRSRLSSSQLAEVETAARQRNYHACLNGYVTCDRSQLASSQLAEVEAAARQRNYHACLGGYVTCNRGKLTSSQLASVALADQYRNYHNCLTYGAGFLCDSSILTAEQRTVVAVADRNRNYYNCLTYGAVICSYGKLTSEQRLIVADAWRSRQIRSAPLLPGQWFSIREAPASIASRRSSQSTLGIRVCAENGSCYGDISELTGFPKTVYVRGYYRRDGTYVRSYYRSPPRR